MVIYNLRDRVHINYNENDNDDDEDEDEDDECMLMMLAHITKDMANFVWVTKLTRKVIQIMN